MPSDTGQEELQVSTAATWKSEAKEGVVIKLPSGNAVRCRRTMDMMHLLKTGRIPNPLSGLLQKMVSGNGQMPDMSDIGEEGVMQMLSYIDTTVVKVVTEPIIVAPPEPGKDEDGNPLEGEESAEDYAKRIAAWKPKNPEHIPLTWVPMDDRMFIFTYAQGVAADLESFREEQAAAMASVANGPGTKRPAKRAAQRK